MARDRYTGSGRGQGSYGSGSRGRSTSPRGNQRDNRYSRDAYGDGRRASYGGGGRGGAGGSGRPPHDGQPRHDFLHSDETREMFSRRTVIAGAFGVMGLACVAKLADYQVVNGARYRGEADARRISSETIFAKRGTIYDRNGKVLVSSVECANVYVDPRYMESVNDVVRALSKTLSMDADECRELVTSNDTFVYIKRQVDKETAEKLEEMAVPGIGIEQAMKRFYQNGSIASQVLGVVNIDNEGISGLELYYDDVLTGVNGSIVRERAADGSYIAGGAYQKEPAQDGTDIALSIDMDIQTAAEQALAEVVENSGAATGSVIVTDPRSGEILACCSYPTYNPDDLANTAAADMNLRIVTDAYEPGSVFKTLVAGMGIEEGLFSTDTEFEVPARILVGSDWVTDVDERDYQMTMSTREILRRSSNVGAVMLGEAIGADTFSEYLETFQLGTLSGVDFAGESTGIVRKREDYDGSSLGSMSFGQGIALSPIEVCRAVSCFANGGIMTTPHFLISKKGETVDWSEGEVRAVSEETARELTSMMVTVVDEGTGTGAAVEGYDVAGKTGTAERASESGGYHEYSYMSSFIGFAPAENPVALAYITLDGTPFHSDVATPAFSKIMKNALEVLQVAPTR